MRTAKLSRLLLVMGATLGTAAVVALALDLRVNIPDWMIQVAMIKLALIGSAGLFVVGAIIGRHANRQGSLRADRANALDEALPNLDQLKGKADTVRLPSERKESPRV
jgi:hypothetical protein